MRLSEAWDKLRFFGQSVVLGFLIYLIISVIFTGGIRFPTIHSPDSAIGVVIGLFLFCFILGFFPALVVKYLRKHAGKKEQRKVDKK